MSPLIARRAGWSTRDRPRGGDAVPRRARAGSLPAAPEDAGGGPTLDELVAGAWERLTIHAVAECPVCEGPLQPAYATHALPIGGRCRECGSSLG